jgi:hypothetical protein
MEWETRIEVIRPLFTPGAHLEYSLIQYKVEGKGELLYGWGMGGKELPLPGGAR